LVPSGGGGQGSYVCFSKDHHQSDAVSEVEQRMTSTEFAYFSLAQMSLKKKKKKKKKKKILAVWRLSGLVLSRCFLAPLGVLFVMKTLKDEQ